MSQSLLDAANAVQPSSPDQQVHGDRTRLIVEAAMELLDEGGLEGLTIRAVLSHTGLARRAFYERFEGKDDLVLAVFEETLREAGLRFSDLAADAPDAIEGLRRVVHALVLGEMEFRGRDKGLRGAALSREHLRLAEARPAELQKALRPLLGLLEGLIARGIASGMMHPDDPALQARLVYNLVSTTIHTTLLAEEGGVGDRARREALAQSVWTFCRRAVAV